MAELVLLVTAIAVTTIVLVVRREPMRFLLMWTALYGAAVVLLFSSADAPVNPACHEFCGQPASVTVFGLLALTVLWLVIAVLVAWLWNPRRPDEGDDSDGNRG